VPPTWNGPVILYDGDPAAVPSCPPEHPTVAYTGHASLVPEPAACAACTCAAPIVTCTPHRVHLYDDAGCNHEVGTLVQPLPAQCGPMAPPSGTQAATINAPTVSATPCVASGGDKTLPPPKWQRAAIACIGGGLGGGCGPGKFCTAAPVAPFVGALCVFRSGDHGCPGGFSDKHLFTDTVTDTRDCGACSCGAPTASCDAVTRVYAAASCGGAPADLPNDGSCVAVSASSASLELEVTKSGSCAPSGGAPIGTITEGDVETTVCCAQ
jgi:hypothetical protein